MITVMIRGELYLSVLGSFGTNYNFNYDNEFFLRLNRVMMILVNKNVGRLFLSV